MKHLLVDNEVIAQQKSEAMFNNKRPNWHADQLAKHEAPSPHPNLSYPHPDTCGKQYLASYRKDELGRCELDIEDDDVQYLPQPDRALVTASKLIADAQS